MRAQLVLALHRNIIERLEGAQNDQRALGRDPAHLIYLESLQQLKRESDKKLLDAIREFAHLTVRVFFVPRRSLRGLIVAFDALTAQLAFACCLLLRTWERVHQGLP